MATLNILATTTTTPKNPLVESINILIEMIRDDALVTEEHELLETALDYIVESCDSDEFDEHLSEAQKLNKMSAKEKQESKKNRLKNRAKIKIQYKKRKLQLKKFAAKRKSCQEKIKGKAGLGCNSKGKIYRVKERR